LRRILLPRTASARFFKVTMTFAGIALAIGLLVVLRYAQIPFFLYYPRTTVTVLISESLDMLLFAGASLCVPPSVLLALQRGAGRRSVRKAGVTLAAVLAVWLLSLVFMSRSASVRRIPHMRC
jgi:hypothetical protein